MVVLQQLVRGEKTHSVEAILISEMLICQKLDFSFKYAITHQKEWTQTHSDLSFLRFALVLTAHIFVLQGKIPNNHAELDCTNPRTQRSWDFFVLSHSDAIGTAKKVEEWLYISICELGWLGQCCPGGISGQLPTAEEINECICFWGGDRQTWTSRFGLLRCFKQNRTQKLSQEQQAHTTAACNTNSSLPSLQGSWKQQQSFGCSRKAAALDLVL